MTSQNKPKKLKKYIAFRAYLCYNCTSAKLKQKIKKIKWGDDSLSRSATTTKYEIIQVASEFFMNVGYSNTSPKMIAEKLGLSTGNITYYFPTKEHLLSVVVGMLCDFQWKMLEYEADHGFDPAASICLETMTVAVACNQSEIARDFFIATFQSELCRNYLRENHVRRAKELFAEQCSGWTDEQFHEAELLVMGLQYAAIIPTDAEVHFEMRIAGALNQILSIYNIDEKTRQKGIENVLSRDCRDISKRVLRGFVSFVEKTNEQTLEDRLMTIEAQHHH